jgi:hypothetical protein
VSRERDAVVYYGALAVVGAFGVIDWPILAAIGVGHWLITTQPKHPALAEVGDALEDA